MNNTVIPCYNCLAISFSRLKGSLRRVGSPAETIGRMIYYKPVDYYIYLLSWFIFTQRFQIIYFDKFTIILNPVETLFLKEREIF